MMTGDFNDAIEPLNKALSIRDDAYFRSSLGAAYYYLGEFDRSVEMYRRATELMPEANFVWSNLGDALRFSSQAARANEAYLEAIRQSTALLEVDPSSAFDLMVKAWATAASGDSEQAQTLIARAIELAPNDPYVLYYNGLFKYAVGEKPAALDALGAAVEMGYPVAMLAADPLLGELHGDQRFEELLAGNGGRPRD